MASAARTLFLSCFRGGGGSSDGSGHRPALWPRFPSRPRRPKAAAVAGDPEKVAVFAVTGMTCAASVEKAIKRLPGIHDAAVDVLACRAQVTFNPALVSEEKIRKSIEDGGFGTKLVDKKLKEKS